MGSDCTEDIRAVIRADWRKTASGKTGRRAGGRKVRIWARKVETEEAVRISTSYVREQATDFCRVHFLHSKLRASLTTL